MWEVDLSGHEASFTRILVVETISPSSDGPGALRFINHRCIIVEKDDDTEILKQQIRQMKFQMVLVEDQENPWHAMALPAAYPLFRRIA
jgi:hypothetical protein